MLLYVHAYEDFETFFNLVIVNFVFEIRFPKCIYFAYDSVLTELEVHRWKRKLCLFSVCSLVHFCKNAQFR